jgi:hypothetical protein|nr:hypothetical protein [Kofleriaceae bacterium]
MTSARDLRVLGEAIAIVVATWLLVGLPFDHAITQVDGMQLVAPYVQESLAAGGDWTRDLYRFGVVGGSEMHPFGGTMPVVQLCALAGLGVTATLDAITWFVQVALAFFAVVAVESLAGARLAGHARVAVAWLAAFAPVVGWRLGVGHENLVLGLLPIVATVTLMVAATARRLTATALAIAAFAVANGVSGLGAQTVVYGAVFGAPLVIASIIAAPRALRWTRDRLWAALALAGGVLAVAPRLASMVAHAVGPDATRGLGDSVVYSWGTSSWQDWLASLVWTAAPARELHDAATVHEHDFPIGPVAIAALALWPRGTSRALWWACAIAAALAIVLADDVAPLSTALLRVLPPLAAFRVPARAALVVAVIVPTLAAAAWIAAAGDAAPTAPPLPARFGWLGVLAGAVIIAIGTAVPTYLREVVAWVACAAVVVVARRGDVARRRRVLAALLAPVAALGVVAFAERLPTDVPTDTVAGTPARLHDAVVAQLPDARSPLTRVEVIAAPPPFGPSTAMAARLGSLDGVWYPPRRFLALWSALIDQPIASTTCNFEMWRADVFPTFQQLYDVVAAVRLAGAGSLEPMIPPAGPAWFPARLAHARDDAEVAAAIAPGPELHARVTGTAYVVAGDAADAAAPADQPAACASAAVAHAAVDADGQVATFDVSTPADCVLVVAANYTSTLRATATVGGDDRAAAVLPVDIALAGVIVPAGATRVVLAPADDTPGWTYGLAALGLLAIAAALAGAARARPVTA